MSENTIENKKPKSQIIYSIVISLSAASIPAIRGYGEDLILVGIVSTLFNLLLGFYFFYHMPRDVWKLFGKWFWIRSEKNLFFLLAFIIVIILIISFDIIKVIYLLLI